VVDCDTTRAPFRAALACKQHQNVQQYIVSADEVTALLQQPTMPVHGFIEQSKHCWFSAADDIRSNSHTTAAAYLQGDRLCYQASSMMVLTAVHGWC
jgi:hypothetical protein